MSDDPRQNLPSASSFHADVACPGRRNLIATLPKVEMPPDPDAERGSKIHRAWQSGNTLELDEAELADYTSGVTHIDDVIQTWMQDKELVRMQELPREERLWLNDEVTMAGIMSGQLDRWYMGWNEAAEVFLAIIDGKSGFGTYVPASQRSWQLRVYCCLAWKETGCINIRAAFVKPKMKADATDWTDYDETALRNSYTSILFHLWESQQPEAHRNPGVHCRYCPAAQSGYCPQAGAWSMLPSVQAGNITPDKGFDYEAFVSALDPADLVKIISGMTVRHHIEDACKSRLKKLPAEELASLGLKLGKPTILRPIVNTRSAFLKLRDEVKVDEDKLFTALSFSNKDLGDVLRREVGVSAKGVSQYIRETLADFIQESPCEAPLKELKEGE